MPRVITGFLPVLLFALILNTTGRAADTLGTDKWNKSLSVDITTTQASYSDSWTGGEAGSVNWVSNLNGLAERQLTHWLDFKTTLKLSFGQTLTQDAETKNWSKPEKSTDLIDWENVGRLTLNTFVDPYAAFRLESQFLDASNPDKKLYFTPVRLTESGGVAKKIYRKKKDFVTTRFGFGLRQILKGNVDTTNLSTVDSTIIDGGFESVTDVELTINSNLRYTGKLSLYKAVYFSEKENVAGTQFEDDWKAIDLNWENILSVTVTKIITVNLYTQLLYDKEISKKGRFKETLAIGFLFKVV